MHGKRRRCDDADPDPLAADTQYAYLDAVADDDCFAPAAGEDEHDGYSVDGTITCRSGYRQSWGIAC